MRITKIVLLSVPFDNSYADVFSNIGTYGVFKNGHKNSLYEYYIEKYEHVEIDVSRISDGKVLPKAIRRSALYSTLNLKFEFNKFLSDIDIYNYNYIVLIDEEASVTEWDKSFWFINSAIEENSVGAYRNYKIELELDVWTNYQNYVYTEQREQLVENTHLKQYKKDNNGLIVVDENQKIYPNQKVLLDYRKDNAPTTDYRILYIKFKVITGTYNIPHARATEIINNKFHSFWNNVYGEYNYTFPLYSEYYIPFMCFDKNDNIIDPRSVIIKDFFGETHSINDLYKDLKFIHEDIVSASYTFNIPSYVVVIKNEDTNEYEVEFLRACFAAVYNSADDLIMNNVLAFLAGVDAGIVYDGNELFSGNINENSFTFNRDAFNLSNFDYDNFIATNPLLNKYPFIKTCIQIGSGELSSLIPDFYNDEISIKCIPKSEGAVYEILPIKNSQKYYTVAPIIIANTSSIPTSINQYDVYLRNNGNQLAAYRQNLYDTMQYSYDKEQLNFEHTVKGEVSNMISNTASNIGEGDLAGAAKSVGEGLVAMNISLEQHNMANRGIKLNYDNAMRSHISKIDDVKNMIDNTGCSQNGTSDIYYVDGMRMYKHTINGVKTLRNVMSLKSIHMYGYNVEEMRDIRKFPMENFTYIKTRDCTLSCKCNLSIKRKLEEILNKGVRCWRPNDNVNVSHMNYECSNYENLEAI